MRIIGLLLAVLIIGLLINRQLKPGPERDLQPGTDPAAPTVPTRPDEVEQFGKDMQEYLDEQARQRAEAIREAEQG